MKNDNNGNGSKHIVRRNGKDVSIHVGTYSNLATMELMQRHPNRLITVKELTLLHFGRVNEPLMQLIRQRLWRAPNMLLDEGLLSFIRYEDEWPFKIVGIKMFNPRTDMPPFNFWYQRIKDRKLFTDEKLDDIKRIYSKMVRGMS
jgi:hypothetical protein